MQPQHLKFWQPGQELDLANILDVILAQVEFLSLLLPYLQLMEV